MAVERVLDGLPPTALRRPLPNPQGVLREGAPVTDAGFGPRITEAIQRDGKMVFESPLVDGKPAGYLSPGDFIILERYTLYKPPKKG